MRVTAIETIRVGAYPTITFVEVLVCADISGLGKVDPGQQSSRGASTTEHRQRSIDNGASTTEHRRGFSGAGP